MKTWIRKHRIDHPVRFTLKGLLLFALLYLIVGATAPFFSYPEVTESTVSGFDLSEFRQGTPGCDRAGIIETNEGAWEERMRLLSRAEERIVLATFDMRPGESTKDILAVLLNRADAGVQVKILVDGLSGLLRMEGKEMFYALSSHPNVEIRLYNKPNLLTPWKLQGRMHDKYVIVDEKAYLLGGRNTFDYFIGTYTDKNVSLDREVLVYNTQPGNLSSSLYELEAYFKGVWNQKECRPFHEDERLAEKEKVREQRAMLEERFRSLLGSHPNLFDESWDYEAHTYETGAVRLLSNPTAIYSKEPVLFYQMTRLMEEARERVVIQSPYVVCNDYMYGRLRELKEKVPDTRLILNAVENGDNFVASSDYLRHKEEIWDTGITLYEYDGGISNHGKSILIDDDLSLIGSYNLDLRSSYLDTELMLVIESKELNRELEGYMMAMEADSRKVLDGKNYEIPAHLTPAKAPLWKRAAWKIFGFVIQPFRGLI